MKGQAVVYQGQVFENEKHARWAVFLDALGLDWDYKPQGHTLYGGQRHVPTFFLGSSQAYLDVHEDNAAGIRRSPLESQVKAAKLATGSVRGVILVYGGPDSYRPILFHAKDPAEPEMHDWLQAAPESIKALGWQGLPEELVIPGRTHHPTHFAWVRHGVGLDFWAGQLAVVTCAPSAETELREDPCYRQQIEVELPGHLEYVAYGVDDPYEPLYVVEDANSFYPQPEYLAALTAATNAKFRPRPQPSKLN